MREIKCKSCLKFFSSNDKTLCDKCSKKPSSKRTVSPVHHIARAKK